MKVASLYVAAKDLLMQEASRGLMCRDGQRSAVTALTATTWTQRASLNDQFDGRPRKLISLFHSR